MLRTSRTRKPTLRLWRRLQCDRLEDRAVPAFGFGSAFAVGGPGGDYGIGVALDASGNQYVSGMFSGTVDFDPNQTNPSSNHVLAASGDYANYAAKYSANGMFQWAIDLGANGQGTPADTIAVQGANVFVGYPTATAGGADNVATVSQLDAGTGAISWTTTLTTGGTTAVGVATGLAGDLFVTANNSASQAFVSRLDSAGNVIWTTTNTGSGTASGSRLIVDAAGNVYATGMYTGSVNFGTSTKTSIADSPDAFVWKLDANGFVKWAGSFGSNGTDFAKGIALDANGNVLVTGGWGSGSTNASQNNNFNPNSGAAVKLTNHGNFDIYISKLVPGTNGSLTLSWAKDVGGFGTDWGQGVAVDAAGSVYSTGLFTGTVNFNPNNGKSQVLSGGGGYVSKLSASGSFVAAASMAGSANGNGQGNGRAITLDGAANIYVAGVFYGTTDFDPTAGTYNLTSNGSVDAFVVKLTQAGTSPFAGGSHADKKWIQLADSSRFDEGQYANSSISASLVANPDLHGVRVAESTFEHEWSVNISLAADAFVNWDDRLENGPTQLLSVAARKLDRPDDGDLVGESV